MSGSLQKFERDGLTILVSRTAEAATVEWHGVSDLRDLSGFLRGVVPQLVEELGGLKVTLDLTHMEYMNSATLSPLLGLVKSLDNTSIGVLVRFNQLEWQQTFQRCVRALARTLRNVSVEEPRNGAGPQPEQRGGAC